MNLAGRHRSSGSFPCVSGGRRNVQASSYKVVRNSLSREMLGLGEVLCVSRH